MREIAPFAKSKFRVANPIYGHTLAPNFVGEDASEFVKILVVMNPPDILAGEIGSECVPVNGICHPELAFGERRYFAH
ncbi:MAG TPA: hypothetical protein VHR44_15385, partial [Beijerinckiaceae bacterium]|nr:hypothetical protein [Beijerinckiaceae bacterium]